MQDLKITVIQTKLFWEDVHKNIENFNKRIDAITEETDLIILPEMFNTGFSINPDACAEDADGETVSWLKEKAHRRKCVIAGSVLINDHGRFYNRLYWMHPDGSFLNYNKRHLFRMSEEYKVFAPGSRKQLTELKSWKILPLICYDLRFPVWSKNTFTAGRYEYDLLIYVANWPEIRSKIWQSLLVARAIENQAYVIGVNRIGFDGHGNSHSGDTMIIDAKGNIISALPPHKELHETVELSYEQLESFRENYTVGLDWDKFQII